MWNLSNLINQCVRFEIRLYWQENLVIKIDLLNISDVGKISKNLKHASENEAFKCDQLFRRCQCSAFKLIFLDLLQNECYIDHRSSMYYH